jgi:hypothetical protein
MIDFVGTFEGQEMEGMDDVVVVMVDRKKLENVCLASTYQHLLAHEVACANK